MKVPLIQLSLIKYFYFLGMSFLNIGSGTGYFSCLAGYLIKSHGINHGVELHEDLVAFSHEKVKDFLQNGPSDASEICPPLLIAGNAFQLDPSQMKYDRCCKRSTSFFVETNPGNFMQYTKNIKSYFAYTYYTDFVL